MVDAFNLLDQYVIDIGLHGNIYHSCEQLVDHPLVGGPCIDQSKRHNRKVINIIVSVESGVLSIAFHHLDMVIAQIGVHESNQFMARGCLNQLVNPGQEMGILWACLVPVAKVYEHRSVSVIFLYYHPRLKSSLFYEITVDEFSYFLREGQGRFLPHSASLLSDQSNACINFDLMGNHILVYFGHVAGLLGE